LATADDQGATAVGLGFVDVLASFVGLRCVENQAALMRHKRRKMLVSQRVRLPNKLHGHLTEVGVIAAQGPR
jgi:transposase